MFAGGNAFESLPDEEELSEIVTAIPFVKYRRDGEGLRFQYVGGMFSRCGIIELVNDFL
ncbi:MAG: hypothetical protein WCH43_13065 [Verrucomicrobiota bacterium]